MTSQAFGLALIVAGLVARLIALRSPETLSKWVKPDLPRHGSADMPLWRGLSEEWRIALN